MNSGNLNYRLGAMLAATLASVLYLLPIVLPAESRPSFLPEDPIHLGLDLRGGTHLLFTVEVDKAVENNVGRTGEELAREMRDDEIGVESVDHDGMELTFRRLPGHSLSRTPHRWQRRGIGGYRTWPDPS